MKSLGETVALGLGLLAFGMLIGHCVGGCTPGEQQTVKENVENAAAVVQYKALMADCRARGKDAGSYAVYDACADEVDRQLCRESSLRCADGGVQ